MRSLKNLPRPALKRRVFSRIYPALVIVGGLIPRQADFFADRMNIFKVRAGPAPVVHPPRF
jgi:hypothetical protein